VIAFSDKKEAAKEVEVWTATDPEVQRMLATEASMPPVMASVYEELSDDPVMALLGEVLADARPRPASPAWNEISVEMQRALFPAYNGDADALDAAETVRSFLESTIN